MHFCNSFYNIAVHVFTLSIVFVFIIHVSLYFFKSFWRIKYLSIYQTYTRRSLNFPTLVYDLYIDKKRMLRRKVVLFIDVFHELNSKNKSTFILVAFLSYGLVEHGFRIEPLKKYKAQTCVSQTCESSIKSQKWISELYVLSTQQF